MPSSLQHALSGIAKRACINYIIELHSLHDATAWRQPPRGFLRSQCACVTYSTLCHFDMMLRTPVAIAGLLALAVVASARATVPCTYDTGLGVVYDLSYLDFPGAYVDWCETCLPPLAV